MSDKRLGESSELSRRMNEQATVQTLFEDQGKDLHLTWVAGRHSGDRKFLKDEEHPKADVVGYFNLIHSSQVQVVGHTELDHLESLTDAGLEDALAKLFSEETAMIVTANGLEPLPRMHELADRCNVGLFKSDLGGERLISDLRYYLTLLLARKTTLHGVFMEVISIGVLLTGASGVGKSELALELITRGHRLIADDAPLFSRIAPDIVVGTSPPVIQDFLEVRGLGVLNIRQMYGDGAVKPSKYLKLIIDLQSLHGSAAKIPTKTPEGNRLVTPEHTSSVLDLEVPIFTLPVAPGRNLAVLVEAAVRNHLLRVNDYYADREIIKRQQEAMHRNEEKMERA